MEPDRERKRGERARPGQISDRGNTFQRQDTFNLYAKSGLAPHLCGIGSGTIGRHERLLFGEEPDHNRLHRLPALLIWAVWVVFCLGVGLFSDWSILKTAGLCVIVPVGVFVTAYLWQRVL